MAVGMIINDQIIDATQYAVSPPSTDPEPTPTPDPEPEIIDGSTITPINDIQTWLKCAEITDKAYTTIGEVLNDSVTLLTLMSNEEAMKYLARSASFADDICSNQAAMELLGNSPHVDDTVLNSDYWVTAIKASPYKELVIPSRIPPFSTASDEDIQRIINGYYSGEYSLEEIQEKWKVGDTRVIRTESVSLPSNYSKSGVTTISSYDNTYVIVDFLHDTLTTPINGKTKALISVINLYLIPGFAVDILDNSNYDNHSLYKGWNGWAKSNSRTLLNGVFYNSFPQYIKDLMKDINVYSDDVTGNNNVITSEKLSFLSARELLGDGSQLTTENQWNDTNSFIDDLGFQYEYYKKTLNLYQNNIDGSVQVYSDIRNGNTTGRNWLFYTSIIVNSLTINRWATWRKDKQYMRFRFCL